MQYEAHRYDLERGLAQKQHSKHVAYRVHYLVVLSERLSVRVVEEEEADGVCQNRKNDKLFKRPKLKSG